MPTKAAFFKTLSIFLSRMFLKQPRNLRYKAAAARFPLCKLQRFPSFAHRSASNLGDRTVVFDVEGALLRSPSLFPYFMLVAFEAGSLLRALVLFLLYPFICLLSPDMQIKAMVMVCFVGIKQDSFRAGRAVLPKFYLEDVGLEGFQAVRRCGRRVGVSGLPREMVESFLRDYMGIESVALRQVKVVRGYFVGVMEDNSVHYPLPLHAGENIDTHTTGDDAIGICGINGLDHPLFSQHCKEIYMVSRSEKRKWRVLPRDTYPKPLVFHDGRLSVRPTPTAALAIFMWLPFGFCLAIARAVVTLTLPRAVSVPLLAFSGLHVHVQKSHPSPPAWTQSLGCYSRNRTESINKVGGEPDSSRVPAGHDTGKENGVLYVCNHRSLLDPLYISFCINRPVTAVTYSLSRLSEVLAPIRTVRLRRDRERDAAMMRELLDQGDVVVCPEGTTCREPYLLRFSPLFSEICDAVVPVALDCHLCMFHGTTAAGLKFLDPLYFLMNPCPVSTVRFLPVVLTPPSTRSGGGESRFGLANRVQSEIGKALGFECTRLTRKDKYLTLAGNEGTVKRR